MGDYIQNKDLVNRYFDETSMSARPNTAILNDSYTSANNFANKPNNYDRLARNLVSRGIFEDTGDVFGGTDDGSMSTSGGITSQTQVSTQSGTGWTTFLGGVFSGLQSVLGLQYQQNQAIIQSQQPRINPAVYVIVGILLLIVIVALITRK